MIDDHPAKEFFMSAPRWRLLAIATWVVLTCITSVWVGSAAPRIWLLLLVFGAVPPAMLLWLWNDDRPQVLGTLRERARR
jgi:hypothetical protein